MVKCQRVWLWYILRMSFASTATLKLDSLGLPYRLFQHATPPGSLEEAARLRGQQPGQVIRSILFRHAQESYVMVLMAGPGQVSWKRIRAHLGVSRISMASESEVLEVTGCELGTVNPLSPDKPIRILADQSVFQPEEISVGSGVRGVAILLRSEDLLRALPGLEIGPFS